MSGGRSSYFGDTQKTAAQIRAEAEQATSSQEFDTEVNDLLGSRLAKFNARDPVQTRQRLDAILDALGVDIDDRFEILMGGSVAKRTYLEGLSDEDCLVVLTNPDLIVLGPEEMRRQFVAALRTRLPAGDIQSIREGTLAATVTYRDGSEIQLLPAVRAGNDVLIADQGGTNWSQIRPKAFAMRLTRANDEQAGRLVPVVKLAKVVIASFPLDRQITGYHVESLAIDAFRHYSGPKTYKAMLEHFFASASQRVLAPMADSTGQSVHVDAALGEVNSLSRRLASDSMSKTARKMASSRAIAEWEALTSLPKD